MVYTRRSSDSEDHQALSSESQLEALRSCAARRGIEIAEEFTESASARHPGRPVFNRIMKLVREGKVKRMLVWRLDRLARNMVVAGALIYELDQGRLLEIITPEASYTATGDAKFALALQFGAAAKYMDDLAAAVKRGNQEVLRKGKVPGPVPLGYTKMHEHERGPPTIVVASAWIPSKRGELSRTSTPRWVGCSRLTHRSSTWERKAPEQPGSRALAGSSPTASSSGSAKEPIGALSWSRVSRCTWWYVWVIRSSTATGSPPGGLSSDDGARSTVAMC